MLWFSAVPGGGHREKPMEGPLRAAGGARVRKEGADGLSGLGASCWKTSPWRPMGGRAVAAITTLPQHRATSPCLSFPIS